LEFWDDGKPKLQIEVTLDTDYSDPADDEDTGERRVFLFGQKLTAAKEELKRRGLAKLEIGSRFKITLTGTKPAKNPRYNDVKLYGIELHPAVSNPAVDALLASGASEVKGAKIDKLTSKQVTIANTLQSNGFDADEIAENLGVSVEAVKASLDF
jgi:DNA-directed RNA polymerase specialized sigma24 family protein